MQAQVTRLMASPRLETGMRAFFSDFLELDTLSSITKDPTIYPKYSDEVANSAREETLRTTIDLTLKKGGDFRDLFTTRKTFINRSLAWVYDVPYNLSGEWMPYEFRDSDGRSGIVTQAAMLGMFSHPGRSSPTKRGVALMDIFLCEPTPTPPANVDFSIVNDTNNPKVPACFVRKLYAYGMGANSEDLDKATVQPLLDGFIAGGYRLTQLLKAIATSQQFFSAPGPEGAPAKLSLNSATR